MIQFLRRFFGVCRHQWTLQKMLKLNEFQEVEYDYEILSSRDFNLFQCVRCKGIKFRKN